MCDHSYRQKRSKTVPKLTLLQSVTLLVDFVWPGFEAFVNPTVISHLRDKLREKMKRYQNKIENQKVEIEATLKMK